MSRVAVQCVGAITVDTIALVPSLPGSDERVVAERIVVAGGGPAATAAVTLARLGVDVAMCGVVGDDDAGRLALEGLEAEGVDVDAVRIDPDAQTVRSIVLVEADGGARSIITTGRVGAAIDVPDRGVWLHADQAGYAAAAAARARRADVRLSVDDGNRIDGLDLALVDLYAPTAAVLRSRFAGDVGAGMRAARAAGAGAVVATAGADGAHVLVGDDAVHVPAEHVDVVSTLGAGDVFHGALLAAVCSGASLPSAAAHAAGVAAASTRGLDGRSTIPSIAELARPVRVR